MINLFYVKLDCFSSYSFGYGYGLFTVLYFNIAVTANSHSHSHSRRRCIWKQRLTWCIVAISLSEVLTILGILNYLQKVYRFIRNSTLEWVAQIWIHLHYYCYYLSWNFHRLVTSCKAWLEESKHTNRSSFANITNDVPTLWRNSQCQRGKYLFKLIRSWFVSQFV